MTFFDALDELLLTGGFVFAGATIGLSIMAAFAWWEAPRACLNATNSGPPIERLAAALGGVPVVAEARTEAAPGAALDIH